MNKLTIACFIGVTTFSAAVFAEPEVIYTQNPAPQTATHRLLELQRSGQNASTEEQYLSGKVSNEVYNRYVKSFSHAIPERFSNDSFNEE
ncbi:DUF3613 domain-containing protein [Zhongshania sp.]|uniref:DUF3613 domain-containing protein n=1 Tax=Zhongshania sp. TaxID=1971902 RepID=UPI001B7035D1|nr:DUF3613 domain-containing protein [Zhongshania sp.]MBQ0794702.1 DUF3613 domain-containing protein [Zhongshania sp.]